METRARDRRAASTRCRPSPRRIPRRGRSRARSTARPASRARQSRATSRSPRSRGPTRPGRVGPCRAARPPTVAAVPRATSGRDRCCSRSDREKRGRDERSRSRAARRSGMHRRPIHDLRRTFAPPAISTTSSIEALAHAARWWRALTRGDRAIIRVDLYRRFHHRDCGVRENVRGAGIAAASSRSSWGPTF